MPHIETGPVLIAVAAVVAGVGVFLLLRATSGGRLFWPNLIAFPLRHRENQRPLQLARTAMHPRLTLRGEKCIACQACIYLCPTRAIAAKETEKGFQITLEQESCLFCGLCEEQCPTDAIHLVQTPGDLIVGAGDLSIQIEVPAERCPECGRRRLPIDVLILRHLYGQQIPLALGRYRVCRSCFKRLEEKIAAAV